MCGKDVCMPYFLAIGRNIDDSKVTEDSVRLDPIRAASAKVNIVGAEVKD